MSQELHYTSAPRGLWPGSQGYCTVACTANLPRSLAERLEGLSAYRNIFPPHDPRAAQNPVVFSHLRVSLGGVSRHVLSRIGFAGLDYSERANKYAHHVVLDSSELPRGGPAWLLSQPGFISTAWDGRVGWIETPRRVLVGDVSPRPCAAWAHTTGDAGWAGILADAFLSGTKPVTYLIHEPGQNILPLVLEAQALLPPERRWELTFSTYVTTLPQGVVCAWRGIVRGTPEEAQARRASQAFVLDLTRPLGIAPDGPLVTQARTGRPAVGRVVADATPPTLPVAATPGYGDPIVIQPVAPMTGSAAMPDLPLPPSIGKFSQRPRQPTGMSWPRKARAIVAAVFFLSLMILGGVGVWLLLRARERSARPKSTIAVSADKARSKDDASPNVQTRNSAKRQDGEGELSTSVKSGLSESATAADGLAGSRSNRPVRQSDSESSPLTQTAKADKERTETGNLEDTAVAKPNEPKARDSVKPGPDVVGSTGKLEKSVASSEPPAKVDGAEGRTVPMDPRRLVVDAPLPLLSESESECTFKLPQDLTGSADIEIGLLGLQVGEEYKRLEFVTMETVGPQPTLSVLFGSQAPQVKLAQFSVKNEKLYFKWGIAAFDGQHMQYVEALKSCVLCLKVAGVTGKEPTRFCFRLRNFVSVPSELALGAVVKEQGSIWDATKQKAPYARELEIHDCQVSDPRVQPVETPSENPRRCRLFRVVGFEHLQLRVELNDKNSVKLTMSPSDIQLRADVKSAIIAVRESKDPQGFIFKHKYQFGILANESAFSSEIGMIREAIGRMESAVNSPEAGLAPPVRHKFSQFAKAQSDAISAVEERIALLGEIQKFKNESINKKSVVSLSIATRIDGELFDVAKIGSIDSRKPQSK